METKRKGEKKTLTRSQETSVSSLAALLAVAVTPIAMMPFIMVSAALWGTGASMIVGEAALILVPLAYMLHKKINVKEYIGLKLTCKNVF